MAVLKYKTANGEYKTLLNYTIKNPNVVGTTGESATDVMSQKAVTDELNKKMDSTEASKFVSSEIFNTEVTKIVNNTVYGSDEPTASEKVVTTENLETTLSGYAKKDELKEGTVTSVGVSVPTGLSVANSPVTTNGIIEISYAEGYSIPETAKQTGWDNKQDAISDLETIRSNAEKGATAEGWGNHANAGYLKGTIETVTVSSNQTNYTKTVTVGQQVHVIFVNSGNSTDYTVAISTSYKTPDGEPLTLTVPKGGYAEANFMNIGGTTYVRGL